MLMRHLLLFVIALFVITGCAASPKEEPTPKKTHVSTSPHMDFSQQKDGPALVVPSYFTDGMADKDHDGIEDGKDRCSDTPIGVNVDAEGCSFDRDQDGIKDYEDECPNSMPHAKIKADGCADFVSFNLFYAPRVNEITPKSMSVLEKAVGFLKEHPEYKVKIIGHTDHVGDDEYNLKLSKDRAEDVLKLFNRKGINFNRLEAIGKGEAEPMESNDTDEGRALNRRIEVELYQ
jgi:OOP family OmpA-OmpF porin